MPLIMLLDCMHIAIVTIHRLFLQMCRQISLPVPSLLCYIPLFLLLSFCLIHSFLGVPSPVLILALLELHDLCFRIHLDLAYLSVHIVIVLLLLAFLAFHC